MIDRDFLQETDEAVQTIPESHLDLPAAGRNEWEPEYNARVPRERSGYLLLDDHNIPVAGRGKVEFCDLLTKDRQLIHIKARKSSSSTLSHLFAQGRVSAITFLENQDYRMRVRDEIAKLNKSMIILVPRERPNPGQYQIIYAIITGIEETQWQLKLPFFSRINLVETVKDLMRSGFRVAIQRIDRQ